MLANTSRSWRESPGSLEQRASLPLGILNGYSLAVSGIPPPLDARYKLEADDKFRALHPLAVNHARQRLDASLCSGNQQLIPRTTVQLSQYACASRTQIFGDGPLIKTEFVQSQQLHCN